VFGAPDVGRVSPTGGTIAAEQVGAINVARAIEQHDCASLDTAFTENNNAATGVRRVVDTARQLGEPINALKFNFRLLNPNRGTEAGNSATTWANFFNPLAGPDGGVVPLNVADNDCLVTRGDYRNGGPLWSPNDAALNDSCRNLVTSQTEPPFLEPSLNDAFPATANWFDDGLNALQTVSADVPTLAIDARPRGIDAMKLMERGLTEEHHGSEVWMAHEFVVDMQIHEPAARFDESLVEAAHPEQDPLRSGEAVRLGDRLKIAAARRYGGRGNAEQLVAVRLPVHAGEQVILHRLVVALRH